jgi:hypothetical protein
MKAWPLPVVVKRTGRAGKAGQRGDWSDAILGSRL